MLAVLKQNPLALLLAVVLHLLLAVFLVVGVDWKVKPKGLPATADVVQARVVDEQQLQSEIQGIDAPLEDVSTRESRILGNAREWQQLFSDDPAEGRLEPFVLDVLPESLVHQGMVAAAAGGVHAGAKPVEDLVVDADGDPCLSRRRGQDGPAAAARSVTIGSEHDPRRPR